MKKDNLYTHYIAPFFQLWRHFGFQTAWNEMCFVLNRKRHPGDFARRVPTFQKYSHLIALLERKYGHIVEKYAHYTPEEWNGENVGADAPIWVYWQQGFEHAPEVVQDCFRSIKQHAGEHPVIALTGNNLKDYVDLPDYVWEKHRKGIFTHSFFSDILRFALFAKYGGFWVDACDFFLNDGFFKEALRYPFYSVRGFDNDLKITRQLWSDGIMACGKGNKYPQLMQELLVAYCKQENYLIDYFVSSCFQNVAYIRLMSLRRMFDAYPFNNTEFFTIRWNFAKAYDEATFQAILKENSVINLTWRVDSKGEGETYYKHLKQLIS